MRFEKRHAVFWLVVVAALVPVIGMSVFAWRMVGDVRRDAGRTDARMRELAWRCLSYADAFGGFPLGEAELRAFEPPAELSVRNEGYPSTRAECLRFRGAEAPAGADVGEPETIDAIFASIEVEWPLVRDVQPILRSKGLPTLQGTVPEVGQWLYAMTERIRAGGGSPPPAAERVFR